MKILIIHDHYKERGGEDIAVESLINLLQSNEFQIRIYEQNNTVTTSWNWKQKLFFLFNTVYSTQTTNEIKKVIKEFKPDIAHIHNVFPLISPSVYRVLHKEKIPIVQTIHNFRFMCPNGLFYTNGHLCEKCKKGCTFPAIWKKCYRNSFLLSGLYALTIALHRILKTFSLINSFIVLNNFTKDKLIESGIAREQSISVIPNFFSSHYEPQKINENDQYLVYIGRLSPEKGVEDVINCARKIPGLRVKIIGTGLLEGDLKKEASVGMQSRIEFTGYLSGQRKEVALRNALAIVIPSKCHEQFPITALEAMALGKPLIVPNISGLNEIVDDQKTGLIYEPGNIDDLAIKINTLLQNHTLNKKLGAQARKKYVEQYSQELYLSRISFVYESLLRQEERN